jgi:hypothetical protein
MPYLLFHSWWECAKKDVFGSTVGACSSFEICVANEEDAKDAEEATNIVLGVLGVLGVRYTLLKFARFLEVPATFLQVRTVSTM